MRKSYTYTNKTAIQRNKSVKFSYWVSVQASGTYQRIKALRQGRH